MNGTSVMLKRCLSEMGRLDAVNIVEEAYPSKVTSTCKFYSSSISNTFVY